MSQGRKEDKLDSEPLTDVIKRKNQGFAVDIRKKARHEEFQSKRMLNYTSERDTLRDILGLADGELKENVESYYNSWNSSDFNLNFLYEAKEFLLGSNQSPKIIVGLISLRKLLAQDNATVARFIIENDLLPRLIQILNDDVPKATDPKVSVILNAETLWIIANLAFACGDAPKILVRQGAVQLFLKEMGHQNSIIAKHALWGLGNLVGEGAAYRDFVLQEGLLAAVKQNISGLLPSTLAWVLSNVVRVKPAPPLEVGYQVLDLFSEILKTSNPDDEIIYNILWGILAIQTINKKAVTKTLANSGILENLMAMIASETPVEDRILLPALKIVNNCAFADRTLLKDHGEGSLITFYMNILGKTFYKAIKKEICWALSNWAALGPKYIDTICGNWDGFAVILRMINEEEVDVRREAVWIICNCVAKGENQHITQLISSSAFQTFHFLLSSDDIQTIKIILEAYYNTFKKLEKTQSNDCNFFLTLLQNLNTIPEIEKLLYHQSEEVANRARMIFDEFVEEC